MANKTFQIKIESILGGKSSVTGLAAPDQFLGSLGINPSGFPTNAPSPSIPSLGINTPSGLLVPVGATKISGSTLNQVAMWITTNPKDNNKYIYGARGSVYTLNVSNTFAGLGDLNDGGTASGNGAAYYDNYIYFARDTTISRYGPLDGTPTFTDDYWVGVLGKTPLTDTDNYPEASGHTLPNHFLHRHSDGRLYIADVVDNKLTLHYIQTTKTTVEGDTDAGSTYGAFTYGTGLWPTGIETYGVSLAIAAYEGEPSTSNARKKKAAKLIFWNTVSTNPDQVLFEELPDDTIFALKNINGTLRIISGTSAQTGFRISTYVGGYSIVEDVFVYTGYAPIPGGVIGTPSRLLFGSASAYDVSGNRAAVYSLGLEPAGLSDGLFSIMPSTGSDNATRIDAIDFQNFPGSTGVYAAWSGGGNYGFDTASDDCSNTYGQPYFVSQMYRIGQPFKVTKIRIPFANPVASGAVITPNIYMDGIQTKYTLQTINFTNYPNAKSVTFRPESMTGEHNFILQLTWSGTTKLAVSLPITIEYELIDD